MGSVLYDGSVFKDALRDRVEQMVVQMMMVLDVQISNGIRYDMIE